jgi:PBSX family phage terminase large subunit
VKLTEPTLKQYQVWKAMRAHRGVICDGSVRSGKSIGADIAWIDHCRTAPEGGLLMVGKTISSLRRNIIHPMMDMLGSSRCRFISSPSAEFYIGRRRIYCVGANDERAEEKIRGLSLVGAYVDEATTIPESFWVQLLARLSVEGARIIATTNPDSPAHWLKRGYIDRADELRFASFHFSLSDNPYLDPGYIEAIEREFTGLWRRRMIDGDWVVAAGAVYEDWEPERHVTSVLPPLRRLLSVGIDYGTNHPTRGYLLAISAEKRPRLVVADEWAPGKMTDAGYSADFRRWLAERRPEWICVDPAAASFKLQLFADGLANVMDAQNAVISGIRTLASLLATDRIVVSAHCTELLKELPGYVWDQKATLRGEDAPLKMNDDCCDALRYAVASTRALWGTLVPLSMPELEEEAA